MKSCFGWSVNLLFMFLVSLGHAEVPCGAFVQQVTHSLGGVKSRIESIIPEYEQLMVARYDYYETYEGKFVSSSKQTPYSCLTCLYAPPILMPILRREFPDIKWKAVATRSKLPHFRVFHVLYLAPDFFGPGKHLYVDPSLRQFFFDRSHEHVPKIFVGSAKELTRVVQELDVENMAKALLDTVPVKEHNPIRVLYTER